MNNNNQAQIVLFGSNQWVEKVRSVISHTATLTVIQEREDYIRSLIDLLAALIIVDGEMPDWKWWATTPKASPATRRIPIVLLSDDTRLRAESAIIGADLAYAPDEFFGNAAKIIHDYARVMDADTLEQLDCECQEALPPLAVEGVRKFNDGEYYRQHDLFEEQWVHTEGPVRDLYRAILQVGVAYYQIERGNYRGALKMLQRSVQWLAILPDHCQGINVEQLRKDSYFVRAELERLGEENFHLFDQSIIRGISME